MRFSIIKKNEVFQKNYMKVGVKKLLRAGMMPARTWKAYAVGMSPTGRLKLRKQMTAAAGKKRAQVRFPCSWRHMALKLKKSFPPWLLNTGQKEFGQENGVELKEAWMRQIREVQTWKQVRGPAGAVMCETRDLGIKWPCWHTLIFGNDEKIDMRFVCPKDVKKMLVQTAQPVYWKKWGAKHEYEELKEGSWLEPGLALLRKKVSWKVVGRKRDCSILAGRMSVNVKLAKAQRSTASTTAQNGTKPDERFHKFFRKLEQKARTSKEEWKWQRGIVEHPLSVSQWNRGHFSMRKWESEKHKR